MNKTLITKGDVNRLGEKIRTEFPNVSEPTLNLIQEHRISFKDSTNTTFNSLCSLSKRINKNSIITYRLKRINTIVDKLQRFDKKQEFSRMWDISGCRCIVDNDRQVYKLEKLLAKNFQVRKRRDYIKTPKINGYKSLHLYLQSKNDDKVIEVQLRNRIDHNWATLVEITDLIFGSQLKEYGKDKKLEKFLFYLSKRKEISFSEKEYIAKILKEYNYFGELSTVFTRNYLEVRKRWLELELRFNHKFFLIETKKDAIPKIDSFNAFNKAESEYFTRYLKNEKSNIVLTHLTQPSYKNISSAYSNYILTVHSVLDDINLILDSLIIESFKRKKYISFLKHYNLYLTILYRHINNLNSEIISSNKPDLTINGNSSQYNEWKQDIDNQKSKILKNSEKLAKEIEKVEVESRLTDILLSICFKLIVKWNSRKLKKH